MRDVERFAALLCVGNIEEWRKQIFQIAIDSGFQQTRVAILPDPKAPIEAEHAFQHSNYSHDWLDKYAADKMHYFDPTFSHCLCKSTPQIWSPELFSSGKQLEMYEEACGYRIRSGVTLPIHGAGGELGIVCFVNDARPDFKFQKYAIQHIPMLSCLRDYILESSLKFIKKSKQRDTDISLTRRELECLKWGSKGKTSWEIGSLLNCSEATVNFHFGNIRRKFKTNSRQQAVVKAIRLGLIDI
jgi:LuxR family quorum-sensing transcriptional regulator LasR